MTFHITVRRGILSGRLLFDAGHTHVDTECWWDPDVKIAAGKYTGYATRMASKNDGVGGAKREAIWLGNGVPYGDGTRRLDGIFIHKGKNAGWSDGCIVADSAQVLAIWNAIDPKDQPNVSVYVRDD